MNTKLIKCGFASNKSEMRWWTASKQYNWRKESSLELSLSETIKLQFCFLCVGGFCWNHFYRIGFGFSFRLILVWKKKMSKLIGDALRWVPKHMAEPHYHSDDYLRLMRPLGVWALFAMYTSSTSTSSGKWSLGILGCGQPTTLFSRNQSDDSGPKRPNGTIPCFE